MATLNGVDLFHQCSVVSSPNPPDVQTNAYPGVNGLEQITLGSRGGTTVIEGYLVASSTANLLAAENAIRGYVTGQGIYTFVDNYGQSWPNVRLTSVSFEGRVHPCAAAGIGAGFCRAYSATLLHLD